MSEPVDSFEVPSPLGAPPSSRSGTPEIRRRGKESTRSALLEAGQRIFGARGYDAATTREIALEAGCSEALLFRYYKDKQNLLREILLSGASRFGEEAHARFPDGLPLLEEISRHLEDSIERIRLHGPFVRVSLSRALASDEFARIVRREIKEPRRKFLTERFLRQRERGNLAPHVDASVAADLVIAVAENLGIHQQLVHGTSPEELRTRARAFASLLCEGLCGLSPP